MLLLVILLGHLLPEIAGGTSIKLATIDHYPVVIVIKGIRDVMIKNIFLEFALPDRG